ncbi:MAG: hypothetical protein JRN21_09410 [Nitrososphaerota archaeon]|nr:hypothetical protein [Nitrososphaerota archaeon]
MSRRIKFTLIKLGLYTVLALPVLVITLSWPDTLVNLAIEFGYYTLIYALIAVVINRYAKTPQSGNYDMAKLGYNKTTRNHIERLAKESRDDLESIRSLRARLEDGAITDSKKEEIVKAIATRAIDMLDASMDWLDHLGYSNMEALDTELDDLVNESEHVTQDVMAYWLYNKLRVFAARVDTTIADVLSGKLGKPVSGTVVRYLLDEIDEVHYHA